jgi:predicted transcriptional regulator
MAVRVIKYDPQATFNAIAKVDIAEGDLCGLCDTNGNAVQADGNGTQGTGATNKAVGFAVKAAKAGQMVALAPICTLDGFTSLTVAGLCYLSTTAGGITQTKTSTNTETLQIVGTARSATEILGHVMAPLQFQTSGSSTLTSL